MTDSRSVSVRLIVNGVESVVDVHPMSRLLDVLRVEHSQVEDALRTHPDVRDVAVVGVPHPDLGEQVTAYVVTAAAVTAQTLVDHVGRSLSAGHRPRRVHFVDELPRSAQGRVRKSVLVAAG